jgi:hypothetical protein
VRLHLLNDILAYDFETTILSASLRASFVAHLNLVYEGDGHERQTVLTFWAGSPEWLRNRRCLQTGIAGTRLPAVIAAHSPPPPSCLYEACSKSVNPIAQTGRINTRWRRNRGACALTSSSTMFSNICNLYYLRDRQQLSELLSVCVLESDGLICSAEFVHLLVSLRSCCFVVRSQRKMQNAPFSSRVTTREQIKTGFHYNFRNWRFMPNFVAPHLNSDQNRMAVADTLHEDLRAIRRASLA